jgi:putative transposase
MAWELKNVENQRKELTDKYIRGESSMTDLSIEYGVSRKTAYKWVNRYQANGPKGLEDLSKAPKKPYVLFNEGIIDIAIELKLKHPTWGPKKVLARLKRDFPKLKWPSPTRLYEIFKEYHLVTSKRIRKRVPATHPLGDVNNSNDVWMADFKGWFLTQDKQKCEPLTITDGFSRYLLKCTHLDHKSVEHVWPVFQDVFNEYGLPNRIRTDNGPPFATVGVGRLSQLSINFIKAGVMPEWINPGHPEENGRHERFHLTLKIAVANPSAENLQEQMIRMIIFQNEYNFERPHEALNMNTPGTCYTHSTRKWDGKLRSPEYNTAEYTVRKVGQNGCIWINQKEYYIGQTLAGEYVSAKESENNEFQVHYGPVYLGKLGKKKIEHPKLQPKPIVQRG